MLGRELKNRYRIVATLRVGGFGQTYIAEDTQRPGRPQCVVKHLMPATHNPQFMELARRLFSTEAEILEKLGRHDQIPQLLAYFEDNNEFFLVQEFIEGYPLSEEMLPGHPMLESQVITILEEVLNILTFVHGYGVIHRDIKPNNIMRRSQDRKPILIDFGAVKKISTQFVNPQTTETPTIAIGTGGYIAPEQALGHPRLASDIYSLGMTVVEALTGISPRNLPEDSVTGDLLWQYQARVSPELAMIIDKMIARNLAQRYQSAAEVLDALKCLVNPTVPRSARIASDRTEAVTSLKENPNPNISQELQTKLTDLLTEEIGPIATIIMKRNCSQAITSQDLLEKLLTVVPPQNQEKFRQKAQLVLSYSAKTPLQTSSVKPSQIPPSTPPAIGHINPDFIRRCEAELSSAIGPMGNYICQRAVKQHPQFSAVELVEFLATQIPDPAKATEFRARFRF
jgi:serine/threonine protein kinase